MSLILFLVSVSAQAQLKADITAKIKATLKDGDSARYIWPTPWPNDGVICGKVNAKNSYGGYTGFKRFVAVKDAIGLSILLEENSGIEAKMVALHCDSR